MKDTVEYLEKQPGLYIIRQNIKKQWMVDSKKSERAKLIIFLWFSLLSFQYIVVITDHKSSTNSHQTFF